jgi:DNA-directed RNA polymerase subunit RPC12/RpoP
MVAKIGFAEGKCGACGKTLRRHRPADVAVCDCYEHCPLCGTKMTPYTPELSPTAYESGEIDVLFQCPNCGYKSKQKPVEIRLS